MLLLMHCIDLLHENQIELQHGAFAVGHGELLHTKHLLVIPSFKHVIRFIHEFLPKRHRRSLQKFIASVLKYGREAFWIQKIFNALCLACIICDIFSCDPVDRGGLLLLSLHFILELVDEELGRLLEQYIVIAFPC